MPGTMVWFSKGGFMAGSAGLTLVQRPTSRLFGSRITPTTINTMSAPKKIVKNQIRCSCADGLRLGRTKFEGG